MNKKGGGKMKPSKIAGGIVINTKGKIAIVSQSNNSWSLPKGHVEPGEKLSVAAIREISEETGIPEFRLQVIKKLGSYVRPKISKNGKRDYPHLPRRITIFLVSTDYSRKLLPRDTENPVAKWVGTRKVARKLTHPKDKKFFAGCLPKIKKFLRK